MSQNIASPLSSDEPSRGEEVLIDIDDLIDPDDIPVSRPRLTVVPSPDENLAPAVPEDDDTSVEEPILDLPDEIKMLMKAAAESMRKDGTLSTTWAPEEYEASGNTGAGAKKLSASAVAPLVAAARGYVTIEEPGLPEATKTFGLPKRNTTQGRRLAECLASGDVLIMPWFTTLALAAGVRNRTAPSPTTIQYRPARPAVNDQGKDLKYEFVGGQKTPIGIHPALESSWIDGAKTVLLAEGLLKGDSALTGYLVHHGASKEDLSWEGGPIEVAIERLRRLLANVPEAEHILFLTIGGVGNWKQNNEWVDLELRGKDVWIGVDGDVASNPNVYGQTKQLWEFLKDRRHARPFLIAPTVDGGEKKVGIDDYLAEYGTWTGLTGMLANRLPDAPPSNDRDNAGRYRISKDGTRLEWCKPIKGDVYAPDVVTDGEWTPSLPNGETLSIGGRIVAISSVRSPSSREIESGILGFGVNSDDAEEYCSVEITWPDQSGNGEKGGTIRGPAEILNYTPDQWVKQKAVIPSSVLSHPEWPPPKKVGEEWLRAMKAHRADEITREVIWDAMGWVPVEGAVPCFVVGDQVIGRESLPASINVASGVGERELAGASRFGVGEEDARSFDDPEYCADIAADIEKTLQTFIFNGAWRNRAIAATVVAAALRPVMPPKSNLILCAVGPARKGKSWTAASMMGFWSARPGDFTGNSLPGSANDTETAIEISVARSPIWVLDDLAPDASRMTAERLQSKIANVVRQVFNGASKRRSDVNLGARKVFVPRAVLIITAENELTIPSARDRLVTLTIGQGALAASSQPTDQIDSLCRDDGAPARVTQALVRFLRYQASRSTDGWKGVYREVEGTLKALQGEAATYMRENGMGRDGEVKRRADTAGEVALSLFYLQRLARHVGVDEDYLSFLTTGGLIGEIYGLVGETGQESRVENGDALRQAISSLLQAGQAHVIDAIDPASPPGGPKYAPYLGWEMRSEGGVPKGPNIGYFFVDEGVEYILLSPNSAFEEAKRRFPDLIPHGQGQKAAWKSALGEGLLARHLLRQRKDAEESTTARRRPGGVDISGSPMRLDVLMNGLAEPEEGSDDEA